jgi:hypothetical protein
MNRCYIKVLRLDKQAIYNKIAEAKEKGISKHELIRYFLTPADDSRDLTETIWNLVREGWITYDTPLGNSIFMVQRME